MGWAIRVDGLRKVFEDNVVALDDVNLRLEEGGIHIVAGPNGAGKTTLLRILYTELLPTEGTVEVLSYDIYDDASEIRKRIGVLPQEITPYEYLSVWEHVYFFALLKGLSKKQATEETLRLLKRFRLEERSRTLVRDLSGGLKRQVLIAQSLVGEADLLLLDEPTVGLDPQARRRTWDIIREINEERDATIIVTTHYLDEVQDFANRVVILNRGKVIVDGDVASVLNKLGYHMMAKLKLSSSEEVENVSKALEEARLKHSLLPNGTVVIWINKESLETFFDLLKGWKINPENLDIQRPSLEEAYLKLIGVTE